MKILFRTFKPLLLITTLLIIFSIPCFGKKLAELKEHSKPAFLVMDPYISKFYIVEDAFIYIYSSDNYNLEFKFGKAGEGPQEFRVIQGRDGLSVMPLKDSLLINSIRKMSFFTKNGKFIKELNTGALSMSMRFQPIGNRYASLGINMEGGIQSINFSLNLYNDKFEKIKEIQKINAVQKGLLQFPIVSPIFYVVDDKIITMTGEDFVINIFNADGNKISSISREYEKIKVTDNYKNGVHNFYKNAPNYKQYYESMKNMFQFSTYFPTIQTFLVADNRIYIQTYLQENGKYEFFVYDINGKFLKRLFLSIIYSNSIKPFPFTIMHNRLYQLIENEKTELWELHGEDIE